MNSDKYLRLSLELHLFFDRIMKEHSIFLEASFPDKNRELKSIANDFQKEFSDILKELVLLANNNISEDYINSNEFLTKNTLASENKTSELSGISIDSDITKMETNLRSGNLEVSQFLLDKISRINKKTLLSIANLIYFKEDVLKQVLACELYTTNYPLLISHITNEAKMYYNLLSKVENRENFTNNYIYEQELFWNNIMKEHALFIKGLLDPSENELIDKADKFSDAYKNILDNYKNDFSRLTIASLKETQNFKEFKVASVEGLLNCKIKSIIVPLLADHVLREANHFLRILNSIKNM